MSKSRKTIQRIDEFLRENYPSSGATYCAEYLDEPVRYIRSRVGFLGLKRSQGPKRKTDGKEIQEDPKIKNLENRVKDLEEINGELRTELIFRVHDNMMLRRAVNEKNK